MPSEKETETLEVNYAGFEKNNLHASAYGVVLNPKNFERETLQAAEAYLRAIFNPLLTCAKERSE